MGNLVVISAKILKITIFTHINYQAMDIRILKDTVTPEGIRIVYAQPEGVCSRQIGVAVEGDTVKGTSCPDQLARVLDYISSK